MFMVRMIRYLLCYSTKVSDVFVYQHHSLSYVFPVSICKDKVDLTHMVISFEIYLTSFGVFHKFHMNLPRVLDSVYHVTVELILVQNMTFSGLAS